MSKNWIGIGMAALLMALIGCGGDGGGNANGTSTTGSTSGGSSSGTSGRSYPQFSLPSNGHVSVAYLGGQGRRGRGLSQIAVLNSVFFQSSTGSRLPTSDQSQTRGVSVRLDAYSPNSLDLDVNFPTSNTPVDFNQYPFEITKMQEIQADGSITDLPATGVPAYSVSSPFDVAIKVFPGRQTAMQVQLSDAMLTYSDSAGIVFDTDLFTKTNYDTRTNALRGFLSDYLAFDVTGMPAASRPPMSSGAACDRVYFSGDGIAVSSGLGATSTLELLDPVKIQSGRVYLGTQVGSQFTNNSYYLDNTDPSNNKVTALSGVWKNFTTVVSDNGASTAIAFPSSNDDTSQTMIVYTQSGGKVTAMWEGRLDYGVNGDLTKGVFKLWPVKTISDAVPDPSAVVTGSISNVISVGGFAKQGDWDVTKSNAQWPFPASGGFSVYRK